MTSFFSSFSLRFLLGTLLLSLAGCEWVEFSPNDHRAPAAESHLTRQNLARLAQQTLPPGDTLRFVFTGDSQRFYEQADDFVQSVNQQPGISFVVVAGDISDFGLNREMRWVNEKLSQLRVPYLTVIGNHDQVANGRAAYQEIFGPLNYTFTYAGTRFIMTDTNGREYNFNGRIPDVPWVAQQLADTVGVQRQVVMSHVPPEDPDFDPALRPAYTAALRNAPRLVFELNGHRHDFHFGQPFDDGVTYINSFAFEKRQYVVLTVWGQKQFRLKTIAF
ncbi:metallophosphoesterase [Hymenobacter sp. DG25B]|nr:metallophosphoesterase [Hymenobacter sp. DG25B]